MRRRAIEAAACLALLLAGCDSDPMSAQALASTPSAVAAFPTGDNPYFLTVDIDNDCAYVTTGAGNIDNGDHCNFNFEQSGGETFHDDNVLLANNYWFCGLKSGTSYKAKFQDCWGGGGSCSPWTEIPFTALPNAVVDPGFEAQTDRFNLSGYQRTGNGTIGVDIGLGYALRGRNNAFIWANQAGWNMLSKYAYLEPDRNYQFSVWIKMNERLGDAYIGVHDADNDALLGILKVTDVYAQSWGRFGVDYNGWARYAVPFRAPPHALLKKVRLDIGYTAPANRVTWMQIDDLYVARTTDMTPRRDAIPWHTDDWRWPWWL